MIRRSKLALIFATVALSAQAATAAPPNAKLWNGTWHLNAAASKWGATGKEASETRSYDYSGGKLSMKSSGKDSAGKETNFTYSAACDGKFSPMTGNPNADSISLTCVSGREIKATSRLHGKVTVQSTATVSADGKHLTLKRTYVGIKGAPTEVLEFTR
jgi:opacity protein-like surface antigen